MGMSHKIVKEIKSIAIATLFFALWIGVLMVLKMLILREYQIKIGGLSMALVGSLILAKVVLILEHVSIGGWILNKPVWVNVVLRTLLYSIGVFFVLVLEKAFEGRHEYGGFFAAMAEGFEQTNLYKVLANTICITGALLTYNVLSAIRDHLGQGVLIRIFLSPPAAREHYESSTKQGH